MALNLLSGVPSFFCFTSDFLFSLKRLSGVPSFFNFTSSFLASSFLGLVWANVGGGKCH
jgi:hypothetical protein